MTFKARLFLALLCLPLAATAADDKGQYAIRGASLITCGVFSQEHAARGDLSKIVASWVDGYVTAINQTTPDTYELLSFESTELIMQVVDRHCRLHPNDRVFAVVNKLFEQIRDDRLSTKSDKITIEKDGREARHYVALIERVQRKLRTAGHYRGKIDGQFGPGMSSAIAAYQKSVGFEPTGFPDQATLWRLLRSE